MIIFRKNALKTISSTERLDESISITNSTSWLTIWSLLILAVVFVFWSIFASISSHVQSQGVFLPKNSYIVDVTALNNGVLSEINIITGQQVEKDQVIAKLSDKSLKNKLDHANKELETTRNLYNKVLAQITEERAKRETFLQQSLDQTKSNIKSAETEIKKRQKIFEKDLIAYKARDITESELLSHSAQLDRLKEHLSTLITNKNNELSNETRTSHQEDIRLDKLNQSVFNAEHNVEVFLNDISSTLIKSPVSGYVVEVKANENTYVNTQTPLVSLVYRDDKRPFIRSILDKKEYLAFLAYVNVFDGKKIKIGFAANVEVDSLDKNIYGVVKGEVVAVSEFPLSVASIASKLANRDLANLLTDNNPTYEVIVKLLANKDSANGLDWTSRKGMNVKKIDISSLGIANFTLEERRPITLAVPWLKSLLN